MLILVFTALAVIAVPTVLLVLLVRTVVRRTFPPREPNDDDSTE